MKKIVTALFFMMYSQFAVAIGHVHVDYIAVPIQIAILKGCGSEIHESYPEVSKWFPKDKCLIVTTKGNEFKIDAKNYKNLNFMDKVYISCLYPSLTQCGGDVFKIDIDM